MSNRGGIAALFVYVLLSIAPAGAQVGSRAAPAFTLSVGEGRLSADIHRIPLRLVLEALARQTPLRLTVSEGARERLVTGAFRALPLDEGLARLLFGISYAVIYAPEPAGVSSAATRQVVELMVFEAAPATIAFRGPETGQLTSKAEPGRAEGQETLLGTPPEWSAALRHAEPAVRIEALERWAEQGAATPLDPLTHALVDADEAVRARAQVLVERVWAAQAEAR